MCQEQDQWEGGEDNRKVAEKTANSTETVKKIQDTSRVLFKFWLHTSKHTRYWIIRREWVKMKSSLRLEIRVTINLAGTASK